MFEEIYVLAPNSAGRVQWFIQTIHFFYQYVCSLGIEPTAFCAANAMLYHWATGAHKYFHSKQVNSSTY